MKSPNNWAVVAQVRPDTLGLLVRFYRGVDPSGFGRDLSQIGIRLGLMLRADCRVLLVHLFLRSEYTSLRASEESTLE